MQTYIFVAEPFGIEIKATSESYKEAYAIAWNTLNQSQKDNLECLDHVETSVVPKEKE